MKTTCIFHSADYDGVFCREIARKFLPPDTTFIGWDFGEAPLAIPEGQINILDLRWLILCLRPNSIAAYDLRNQPV